MADTLNRFTRGVKVLYESITNRLLGSEKGIESLLFPIMDMSTNANFAIDRYSNNQFGVTFRRRGEQSPTRPYNPGTGTIHEVPVAGAKTAITEQMRDAVVAGFESIAGFAEQNAKLAVDIIEDHAIGHNITKWKLAIDLMRTGIFNAYGMQGEDIEVDIDFSRASSQDITYDFTAAGASIDAALKAMVDAYIAKGGSKNNLVFMMGNQWLNSFETDSDVLSRMRNNTINEILQMNMVPPQLQNVKGLFLLGRYKVPGTVAPAWLTSYSPDINFMQYNGATAEEFMPTDECVLFSLDSPRYQVYRGVDIIGPSGTPQRVVGELVFDRFTTDDPVAEYLRSQSRYIFVPGDVNRTVRSTGTFDES